MQVSPPEAQASKQRTQRLSPSSVETSALKDDVAETDQRSRTEWDMQRVKLAALEHSQ